MRKQLITMYGEAYEHSSDFPGFMLFSDKEELTYFAPGDESTEYVWRELDKLTPVKRAEIIRLASEMHAVKLNPAERLAHLVSMAKAVASCT